MSGLPFVQTLYLAFGKKVVNRAFVILSAMIILPNVTFLPVGLSKLALARDLEQAGAQTTALITDIRNRRGYMYEYQLEGRKYEGADPMFRDMGAVYPGRRMIVWYLPQRPDQSTLNIPSMRSNAVLMIAIALGFAVIIPLVAYAGFTWQLKTMGR